MRTLAIIFAVILLTGCSQSRSIRTESISSTGATISYIDCLDLPARQLDPAHPILVALAAGGLNFGVESLKRWALAEAKSYEVKTTAGSPIHVGSIRHGASPPWHSTIQQGGALLYLRVIEVPNSRAGAYGELVLAERGNLKPEHLEKLAEEVNAALQKWNKNGNSNIKEWAQAHLVETARSRTKPGRTTVLSLAVVLVMQQTTLQQRSTSACTPELRRDERTLEMVLAGYMYPVVQTGRTQFASMFDEVKQVKTMFMFTLEGPGGATSGLTEPYEVSAAFELKSDKTRKATPGEWKLFTGTRYPRSKPFAVPSSRTLMASGTLVETNSLNKTFKAIAEFIGNVKLSPADVGIEKDG